MGDDQHAVQRWHDLAHRERDGAGVDPDQEIGAPVLDEVARVLHAHVDLQLLVAEAQLDGPAADSALGVDFVHRQGGALAHELSVSSERAGEDRLAADLDRFLELQIQGRGSERPGQPEAGDGEGAGLEETAACTSASRCHGETSDSEWDRDDWFSEGGKSKRCAASAPCAIRFRDAAVSGISQTQSRNPSSASRDAANQAPGTTTTFPFTLRCSSRSIAAGASSRETRSLTAGLIFPSANHPASCSTFRRCPCGSCCVHSPQYTPTRDRSLSSARLSFTCGITPEANPITRRRPPHAVARNAASVC